MTDFSDDMTLHGLWQRDAAAFDPMPVEEIRRRASRLGDIVARRNLREYMAAAIVIAGFAVYAVVLPGLLFKLGSLLVIAGTLFVSWQLTRRTSRPDPAAEATDIRSYYRARLVREEHMLSRVGRWYLAPLLPGLLLFMTAQALDDRYGMVGSTVLIGGPLLLFGAIWLLNRRGAAMLRRQIARIDRDPPAPVPEQGE